LEKLSLTVIQIRAVVKDLDGNFTVEMFVSRAVNLTHPARTDLFQNAVVTQFAPEEGILG